MLSRFLPASFESSVPRETESINPIIIKDEIAEDPPDDMNGSGLPVVGNTPIVHPMFKNA